MQRTTPPFRADHVGSLLRSAALKEARARRERGEIAADEFKAVEDREIETLDSGLNQFYSVQQCFRMGGKTNEAWRREMEYDSDRAGGFEPLRFVPKGKTVVLGLVTSKSGRLEGKDQIKRRIEQAAKFVPLEQLCLSPQCGFASTEEGNILAEDEQWAKLKMIVEIAEEVWG